MKLFRKIKAGALQFVLFIGTVIAILLMAFVLISHGHNYFYKRTDLAIDLIQEAHFGLLSSFQAFVPLNDSVVMNASSNGETSVSVHRELWGVFEKTHSTAEHKNLRFVKTALIGGSVKDGRSALYLEDRKRPLVIAGRAKITGDVLLPAQGIRTGNISGNSYQYGQLVYGKIGTSRPRLPELDRELLAHIDRLSQRDFPDAWEPISLDPKVGQRNSFRSPAQLIFGETVYLDDTELIGNILVSATRKIVVGSRANLRDVILLAPEIEVRDNVTGCFQAIAGKNITVGKKCRLTYPSALVLKGPTKRTEGENKENSFGINVGTDTDISGMVVYLGGPEDQRYAPQVHLSEGSSITGEIYCQGNLELEGSVIGSVMAKSFVALKNGSIYQNHLYNGTINSTFLAPEYAGLLMGDVQGKSVVKWLY